MPLEHSPKTLRNGKQVQASGQNMSTGAGSTQTNEQETGSHNIDDSQQDLQPSSEEQPAQQDQESQEVPQVQQRQGAQEIQQDLAIQTDGQRAETAATQPATTAAGINAISNEAKVSQPSRQLQSLVVQTPREVAKFDGRADGSEWIKSFNRTARWNDHDETQKLRSVSFAFTGPAADWYDNEEDQFESWTEFEAAFRKRFISVVKLAEPPERNWASLFSRMVNHT